MTNVEEIEARREKREAAKADKLRRLADHIANVSVPIGARHTMACPSCKQPKFGVVRGRTSMKIGCMNRACDLHPVMNLGVSRTEGTRPLQQFETPPVEKPSPKPAKPKTTKRTPKSEAKPKTTRKPRAKRKPKNVK